MGRLADWILRTGGWSVLARAVISLVGVLLIWWVFGGGKVDSRATQLGALVGVIGLLWVLLPTALGRAAPSGSDVPADAILDAPDRPPPTPHFSNRGVDQEQVRALMTAGAVVAIEGAPGTGKTQLALAIARDFEKEDRRVAWLRGSSRAQLRHDVATLISPHGKPSTDAFRHWLADSPAGLIIVDGLASKALLGEWDCTDLAGNVLVTMRGMLGEYGDSLELTNWDVADAARFVSSHTHGDDGTTELAEHLSGNPLLVASAVAFMNDAGIDAPTYLGELRRLDGLASGAREATPHENPLEPVIRVAMSGIEDKRVRQLLLSLAFMEGEGGIAPAILRDVWKAIAPRPTRSGVSTYAGALAALGNAGLVRPHRDAVFLHKHVARTLIQQVGTRDRSAAVLLAADSLEAHMRLDDETYETERLKTLDATLGHILSVASWTESLTPTSWPRVFNWPLWMSRLSASIALASVAGRLLDQGDDEEARASAMRAFELARSAFPYAMGFYPPEVRRCMPAVSYTACAAATMCYRTGDVVRAMEILDWALLVLRFKRWNPTRLRLPVAHLKARALIATNEPEAAVALLREESRSRGFRRLAADDDIRIEAQRCLDDALVAIAVQPHG